MFLLFIVLPLLVNKDDYKDLHKELTASTHTHVHNATYDVNLP